MNTLKNKTTEESSGELLKNLSMMKSQFVPPETANDEFEADCIDEKKCPLLAETPPVEHERVDDIEVIHSDVSEAGTVEVANLIENEELTGEIHIVLKRRSQEFKRAKFWKPQAPRKQQQNGGGGKPGINDSS